MFTEEDENWYETVLQRIKKLKIRENEKLMTCEWSYWITCHNDEYEKHYKMKKWNQYYSWELWKSTSYEKKWLKESLYRISIKKWQWVQKNHNHKKHKKISSWKKCINDQCRKHYQEKQKTWWKLQESEHHVKEEKYH